jgi:hypothetical protein
VIIAPPTPKFLLLKSASAMPTFNLKNSRLWGDCLILLLVVVVLFILITAERQLE